MEQSKSPKALAYASTPSFIQTLASAKQPKNHQISFESPNETQRVFTKSYWTKFPKKQTATSAISSSRTRIKATKRKLAIITMRGGSRTQR